MKRLAWFAGSGALLAWGFAGVIGGCGADDAAVDETPEAGAEVEASVPGSSGSSGTSGTSGGPTDGGGGGEGGGDGGGEGGGGLSNPNKVSCGAAECATGDLCCIQGDGGQSCVMQNNQCQGIGAIRLECDENADCDPGERCCLGFGGGGTRAQCDNNCNMTEVDLCKTNAQCADGGACKEITCFGGQRKFLACNKPAGCN